MLIVIISRNDAVFDPILFFIRRQGFELQVLSSLVVGVDQFIDRRREFSVVDFIQRGGIADGADISLYLSFLGRLGRRRELGYGKDAKTRMMETQISISNMEKPFRIVMIKKLLSRSNNGRGHIE